MKKAFLNQAWFAGGVAAVFILFIVLDPTLAPPLGFWLLVLYTFLGPLQFAGAADIGTSLTAFLVYWTLLLCLVGGESSQLLIQAHHGADGSAVFFALVMLLPIAIVISLLRHAHLRRRAAVRASTDDDESTSEEPSHPKPEE